MFPRGGVRHKIGRPNGLCSQLCTGICGARDQRPNAVPEDSFGTSSKSRWGGQGGNVWQSRALPLLGHSAVLIAFPSQHNPARASAFVDVEEARRAAEPQVRITCRQCVKFITRTLAARTATGSHERGGVMMNALAVKILVVLRLPCRDADKRHSRARPWGASQHPASAGGAATPLPGARGAPEADAGASRRDPVTATKEENRQQFPCSIRLNCHIAHTRGCDLQSLLGRGVPGLEHQSPRVSNSPVIPRCRYPAPQITTDLRGRLTSTCLPA